MQDSRSWINAIYNGHNNYRVSGISEKNWRQSHQTAATEQLTTN
jgi:hypothetical protein